MFKVVKTSFNVHEMILKPVNIRKRIVQFHYRFQTKIAESTDIKKIRNIGIIAHIDAGKTTTTERMLYYSGFSRMMGEVHNGDTIMDYMAQERERGITITSAAITFDWKKNKINLVDTPGHVDFTIEVERSLCVLDGAIAILDSSAGVEVQTLTVWNQANRYSVPCVIYLNKMDKPTADIDLCLTSLKLKLNVNPLLLQMPLGKGKNFRGVVDIISMHKLIWDNKDFDKNGSQFLRESVCKDDDFWALAVRKREELIENIADFDDTFANKFILEGSDSFSTGEIYAAIRRITFKRTATPVLCGSSYKNIAVQPLMDAVIMYLPHPGERFHNFLHSYNKDTCAFVFKIIHDKKRGPLTFLRLYSGSIKKEQRLYNLNRDVSEKISNLMIAHADHYQEVPTLSSGNIAVVTGLKKAVTGDILLCSSAKNSESNENCLPEIIKVPDPVFFCTIEPPSLGAQKQLDYALLCLQREDPTFCVEYDEELGQTILSGMGELHIEVMKERIFREYGIDAYLGPIQVAYKETIDQEAVHTHVLEKNLGGTKHYVKITIAMYPDPEMGKFKEVKVIATKDNELGKIRLDHLKAVNNAVKSTLNHGPVLSVPVIDVKFSLMWLEVRKGTSLPMIAAATSQCIQAMMSNSRTYLLEPIMLLSITLDKGYTGRVLNDLSQKRSQILNVEAFHDIQKILSRTPLSELKGFSTTLRALTAGTCTFSMEFDCYEQMGLEEQTKAVQDVTGFAPL